MEESEARGVETEKRPNWEPKVRPARRHDMDSASAVAAPPGRHASGSMAGGGGVVPVKPPPMLSLRPRLPGRLDLLESGRLSMAARAKSGMLTAIELVLAWLGLSAMPLCERRTSPPRPMYPSEPKELPWTAPLLLAEWPPSRAALRLEPGRSAAAAGPVGLPMFSPLDSCSLAPIVSDEMLRCAPMPIAWGPKLPLPGAAVGASSRWPADVATLDVASATMLPTAPGAPELLPLAKAAR